MKTSSLLLQWALCAVLLFSVAHAKDYGDPHKWLTAAEEQSLTDTVPPPPGPDSAVAKADLAAILKAQKDRTPAIIAECKLDEHFTDLLFQPVFGDKLTPENSPKLFTLIRNTMAVTHVVNGGAKDKYKRLRPYQGHPDEVKSLFTVSGYSYPSGHSMGSYTLAVVLGAVFPDKKEALLQRAAQIAQSRVDAGVHYPSDIAEGKVLGLATGAAIIANPTFQADLAAVQAELKK